MPGGSVSKLAWLSELVTWGVTYGTFSVQHETENELDEMFRRMPLRSSSVFLDLGCGAGTALVKAFEFSPCCVVGLDLNRGALQAAKAMLKPRHQKYLLVQGDMARLPFKPEAFSHVCCRLSLPYVDQKRAIEEVGRVMDRGGLIFLQVHSFRFYAKLLLKEIWNWKRVILNSFCLLNGLVFHFSSHQLTIRLKGRPYRELYQTEKGMRCLFGGVNLTAIWVENCRLFRLLGMKNR